MKQSTHIYLTKLSKKPFSDSEDYLDESEDFERGFEAGWHDAEIKIAQEVLRMEAEDGEDENVDNS